jgi:hypothetical protein
VPLCANGDGLRDAIDALAAELTGDPEYYWLKPAVASQDRD